MVFSKFLDQTGDTIVEVLLAMAIVGLVLGGAFVSANHSLANSRQAQERGEALKIAESQIEQIKQYAKDSTKKKIFDRTQNFCIDTSGNVVQFGSIIGFDPSHDQPSVNDPDPRYDKYPAQCKFSKLYYVTINYRYLTDSVFTLDVRWDRALVGGRDDLKMSYKLQET